MDDDSIRQRITDLVAAERDLRDRLQAGDVSVETEHTQLRELAESLDQCWDLLRQRDARRNAGQDPDAATARPVSEVENYRQ